ncbi:MAG TPA: CARDB domain-containing protein [Candidatus Baltobacteraceae bacterium]|nr:CARDB domain-containing protein [Candidatus Baltobacteraceae bacterium]
MFRIAIFAVLALSSTSMAVAAGTCPGSDPAIVSVAVANVTSNGNLNEYHIKGTVTNVGASGQAGNVLQSVDIYIATEKLDAKSVPPLGAGESATFAYVYQRSKDAGEGTTRLRFVLDMHNPSPAGKQNCSTNNDQNEVTF